MKILSLISRKGGSGKTTTAINLAIAASAAGKQVALIDIDEQGSTSSWSRLRDSSAPAIIAGTADHLPRLIEAARQAGADLIIIDTPPNSNEDMLLTAKLADLVLIPTRPTLLDLNAIRDSVNIAQLAKKPALIVINAFIARSPLTTQTIKAISALGFELADTQIGSRTAFQKSLPEGKGISEYEPHGKAAAELNKLYAEISTHPAMRAS